MSETEWKIGDEVEVRTAKGDWLRAVARSMPRYDVQNAINRRHPTLTVSVDVGTWGHPVNWPAEDVRTAGRGVQ